MRCGVAIRRAAAGHTALADASQAVCELLFNELRGADGERACALVRAYKTHRFAGLPLAEQQFASALMSGDEPSPDMRCLTLVGTAGVEPAWNDRRQSVGHRAIPLPRPDIVERAPMIAQLIRQFGLELSDVVEQSPGVVASLEGRTYGVFHVESAGGSPYIPAQDFVSRHGIRSVVGCGGALRGGNLFALILFCRLPVPEPTADRFRTLALDLKSSLFNYDESRVFGSASATG